MRALLALLTVVAFVCAPTAARADYFSPYYADDANHDFYLSSSLSTTQKNAFRLAMSYLDSETDMYDTEKTILWAGTDINAYAGTVSAGEQAGWYAWAVCNTTASANVCDRWHVVFNNHLPHSNYTALSCHEIGHTIGLDHQPGKNSDYSTANRTCMRSNPDHIDYSVHDIGHINTKY